MLAKFPFLFIFVLNGFCEDGVSLANDEEEIWEFEEWEWVMLSCGIICCKFWLLVADFSSSNSSGISSIFIWILNIFS